MDFHDALQTDEALFALASRRDGLDVDPFFDPEGIEFPRRHVFLLRKDGATGEVQTHLLSKARPAHTAMRVIGDNLLVFINDKAVNQDFVMEGRLFQLNKNTLRPLSVTPVFSGENWGWDPWIDEHGSVHHKDSDMEGNPYRIGTTIAVGKTWRELSALQAQWRADHCPFPTAYGPGRETGYLRFLDVDPAMFLAPA